MAEARTGTDAICARPEVLAALASGDWTVVLRAFLDDGLSQTVIAARAGLSQSQVSRLVNGKSREPGMNTVKALCDGLSIPRRLAGLQDGSGEEDETDRRQFLGGSLGVLAAAAFGGGGLEDERLLMATSLSYRQLEQRTPARALIQPVTAHLSLARDLARRAAGNQQARRSAAMSEIAGLAAWLHADQADAAQARRFYKMSIATARQAGHPLLAIYMQGSFGQYASTAGDPASGLRLIRDATARLPRSAPGTARAWLSCLEAVSLGYLGDRAALKVLGDAQRYADAEVTGEPVWPWVFQFDSARIDGYRAITAARLGQPKIAAEAFDRASALSRSPKQAALVTVEQARCLASTGQLDQACALAVTAHDLGGTYDSERVRQAVREFRAALGSRRTAAIADLDERLHTAYTARSN